MDITKTVFPHETTYWGIKNIDINISEDMDTKAGTIMIPDKNGHGKIKLITKEELDFLKDIFEIEEDL